MPAIAPIAWGAAKFLGGAVGFALADAGIRRLGGSPEQALQKRARKEQYAQSRAMGMLVEGERYSQRKRAYKRQLRGGDEVESLIGAARSINALDLGMPDLDEQRGMAEAFVDAETGPGVARRVKEAATRGEVRTGHRARGITRRV